LLNKLRNFSLVTILVGLTIFGTFTFLLIRGGLKRRRLAQETAIDQIEFFSAGLITEPDDLIYFPAVNVHLKRENSSMTLICPNSSHTFPSDLVDDSQRFKEEVEKRCGGIQIKPLNGKRPFFEVIHSNFFGNSKTKEIFGLCRYRSVTKVTDIKFELSNTHTVITVDGRRTIRNYKKYDKSVTNEPNKFCTDELIRLTKIFGDSFKPFD
jgi:hypothetical protein